jgi:hypothetical protein
MNHDLIKQQQKETQETEVRILSTSDLAEHIGWTAYLEATVAVTKLRIGLILDSVQNQ